jgi:hypothetical protein
MVQKNGPAYNGPPASKDAPGGKTVHKDKARPPTKPGDDYGHPYVDHGPAGYKGRRPLNGGIFPDKRQKEQGGDAKRYYQQYYRQKRPEKLNKEKRRYEKNKGRSKEKLYREKYRENRDRFERKPGGGYRDPAERTKEWREQNPGKGAGLWSDGDWVLTRGNPSQDSETYHDRGRGYDKKRKQWDERKKPLPNSYPYGQAVQNNQGGPGRVIPHGKDYKNKDQRELKQAALRWRDLSWDLRDALKLLIRTDLWKAYTWRRAKDTDIVRWFNEQGVNMTIKEWMNMTIKEWKGIFPELGTAKWAARISDIEDRCSQDLHGRSRDIKPKLRRVDAKRGLWTFEVPGSKGTYTVKVQAFRQGSMRTIAKLDVYVACSCPFWQWQGPEHWAKQGDYLYGRPQGLASKPDVRDPKHEHGACKHVLAVFGHLKDARTLRKKWRSKRGAFGRKERRDEYKKLRVLRESDLSDPNLYSIDFVTPAGPTVFGSKNMQGLWEGQVAMPDGSRRFTKKLKPRDFWQILFKANGNQAPTNVNTRFTYIEDPAKFSPEDVTSFLKRLKTNTGGPNRNVYHQVEGGRHYWEAEPRNRQRLDHYVGSDYWPEDDEDPEGWDEDGWEEDYAGPLRASVEKALDKRFGKGMFWVEIGEKGHIDVQATPAGVKAMGAKGRRAGLRYLADSLAKGETRVLSAQRVAARYLWRAIQAQRRK